MTLHVVNTVYQLFNTINYRLNVAKKDEKADLILSDHTPYLHNYYLALVESGLFEEVFLVNSIDFCKTPDIQNKNVDVLTNAKEKIKLFCDINVKKYKALMLSNFDLFNQLIFTTNPKLIVYVIEDGYSTYTIDWEKIQLSNKSTKFIGKIFKNIKAIYTYSPNSICYDINYKSKALPKIDNKNKELVSIFNEIFDYKKTKLPKYIFTAQCFKEDRLICNDLEFMKAAFDIVGYENLYIKQHPRSVTLGSKQMGLSEDIQLDIPFELLLLNDDLDDNVLISVCSTTLISPKVIFNQDIPIIYLYNAITGSVFLSDSEENFRKYMDKVLINEKFNNYVIPHSLEHYKRILNHLVSKESDNE